MLNTVLHKATTRGHSNHDWLDSHHTFSFGGYHDPDRMHFGAIRVLNDDIVNGGMGFGKHPHDNMEIISIPIFGALQHNDSTGRNAIINTGDVQIMSAGSGLSHSELNASKTNAVNFLQIWVFPKLRNISPRYEQKSFSAKDREGSWQLVVSPEKEKASLWINQDTWFSLGDFKKETTAQYALHSKSNGLYVFMIEGDATINDQELNKRDGFGIWNTDQISLKAGSDARILLMEVPMEI